MLAARVLLAILLFERLFGAENAVREVPAYTPSSIANAASNEIGALAPNTIAYIKGDGLSFVTRALQQQDVPASGIMPTVLPGTGVRVSVGNIAAQIYYVSPKQVNFLVPANLRPGPFELQVFVDGVVGPRVPVKVAEAAPAFFEAPEGYALSAQPDGSVILPEQPVAPGSVVVTYATGLGETAPAQTYGQVARAAAWIRNPGNARLLLGDREVDPDNILYMGISPGFAGLYQINWKIPEWAENGMEFRLSMGEAKSKQGLKLAIR